MKGMILMARMLGIVYTNSPIVIKNKIGKGEDYLWQKNLMDTLRTQKGWCAQ